MSATNVSIRLGIEGKAEIKRAFEEVGQSGQAAFVTGFRMRWPAVWALAISPLRVRDLLI